VLLHAPYTDAPEIRAENVSLDADPAPSVPQPVYSAGFGALAPARATSVPLSGMSPRPRDGLPYNSGPFHRQLGMVQRTIVRLAFPGGKHSPGAYDGPLVRGKMECPVPEAAHAV
jgi:hypothetical protein